MMQILALSDLHGHLPTKLPPCDAIVIAGDICPHFNTRPNIDSHAQQNWWRTEFADWVNARQVPVIATLGNHDWLGVLYPPRQLQMAVRNTSFRLLMDAECRLPDPHEEGRTIRIYGSPWSNAYGSYPFMWDEEGLARMYEGITPRIDILLSHGPAYHLLDRNEEGMHQGSKSLRVRLDQLKDAAPTVMVCGHIHEAHGRLTYSNTTIINASILDRKYQPHGYYYTFTI